jgi:hypothetical protein
LHSTEELLKGKEKLHDIIISNFPANLNCLIEESKACLAMEVLRSLFKLEPYFVFDMPMQAEEQEESGDNLLRGQDASVDISGSVRFLSRCLIC